MSLKVYKGITQKDLRTDKTTNVSGILSYDEARKLSNKLKTNSIDYVKSGELITSFGIQSIEVIENILTDDFLKWIDLVANRKISAFAPNDIPNTDLMIMSNIPIFNQIILSNIYNGMIRFFKNLQENHNITYLGIESAPYNKDIQTNFVSKSGVPLTNPIKMSWDKKFKSNIEFISLYNSPECDTCIDMKITELEKKLENEKNKPNPYPNYNSNRNNHSQIWRHKHGNIKGSPNAQWAQQHREQIALYEAKIEKLQYRKPESDKMISYMEEQKEIINKFLEFNGLTTNDFEEIDGKSLEKNNGCHAKTLRRVYPYSTIKIVDKCSF